MSYSILSKETIPAYIERFPRLRQRLGDDQLSIQEVGDGNLNYVYVVKTRKEALVIKQAVPYLRCAGESWPLSRRRMLFETAALKKFHELTPKHIPEIYHVDEEMSLVAMQYLHNHIILRKGIINGQIFPSFAEHAAHYLADILFKTSSYYCTSKEKRELENCFNSNHDLCKLTEDLVFTFPYMDHETNSIFPEMKPFAESLQADEHFKHEVLSLKYYFMNQRDALLHGDLHTGSIMVNDTETFIIDPEFAFYGPFGFDLGALIANLILAHISHLICDEEGSYSQWLLTTLTDFWHLFEQRFLSHLYSSKENAVIHPNFLSQHSLNRYYQQVVMAILQQSVGFAGCKMARRILGLAGVADIREITDPALRLKTEGKALKIAVSFVKKHKYIHSFAQVLELIHAPT